MDASFERRSQRAPETYQQISLVAVKTEYFRDFSFARNSARGIMLRAFKKAVQMIYLICRAKRGDPNRTWENQLLSGKSATKPAADAIKSRKNAESITLFLTCASSEAK